MNLITPSLLLLSILARTTTTLAVSSTPSEAPNPTAKLSYGTFEGRYSKDYNITYFRKIPFAAPPVGANRFRGPQPPLAITNGTYDSDGTFDLCPQRTVNGSEDCLFLGLYSRPWSAGEPLRPVMVDFYGGAFIQGGGSFSVPPSAYPILNVSKTNEYITILPNYRVNAFGFLPGKAIAEDPKSDLNPGLLDQHAVLKWVQQHIKAFGGDPGDVTIWGQSAGAGSVVAQALANPEVQAGLITRALASSPFWPHNYRYDSPESEAIYERFASLAGCSGPDSLRCLKAADVQTLRDASLVIDDSHTYNTSSYTWAPVIDDIFLNVPLSQAGDNIRANLPGGAWAMYNTREGENFIPSGLQNVTSNASAPIGDGSSFNSSTASLEEWVAGFLPNLTASQRSDLLTNYYPPIGTTETISYNTTYTRAGLIYRDIVLACPAYWLSVAQPERSYLGEYTIPPATHGSDTQYWNQVSEIQTEDPMTYRGMAGAFASWFATGNPNERKVTASEQADVPFLSTGKEWTIGMDDFGMQEISQLERRCGFWESVAGDVPAATRSGIVQALAQESSENTIIVVSRKKSDAEEAILEAQKSGCRNAFYPLALEITSDKSINAAVKEIQTKYGSLDVLINNAGLGLFEDNDTTTTWRDTWTRVLDTNVTSVRLLTQAFLPLLHNSPSPRVVNISSARGSFALSSAGSNPPTASIPYSVSKAALNMLTLEMGKAEPGVKFYAVSPGHCRTAFNGFRGKKEPLEGGRCAAELALAGKTDGDGEGVGEYESGFWEFEGQEMREVGW